MDFRRDYARGVKELLKTLAPEQKVGQSTRPTDVTVEARHKAALVRGLTHLAETLRVIFGPNAREVVIRRKDGTTIITQNSSVAASEIELQDPHENLGVQLARKAGSKTRKVAGAGMATTILLAESIAREGVKAVKLVPTRWA